MTTTPLQLTELKSLEEGREVEKAQQSYHNFRDFLTHIFSQSIDILKDGKFVGGDYPMEIADWYQAHNKTIRVSARDHMKSMGIYALIMWKIYRMQWHNTSVEGHYFSYTENMARYHLTKIKTAIESNKYYKPIIDMKGNADSILSYSWDGITRFGMKPSGLLKFKRGIHSPFIVVDDPLQDPENKLLPVTINKINTIMKTQVLDMVQDEIHIVGTAQTNFDFYFDKDFTHRFAVRIDPAIKDEKNKIVLWKEWMDYDELMAKKRERTERIFNQEYLCSPTYTENAFLHKDRILARVNDKLVNYSPNQWRKEIKRREEKGEDTRNEMVAGWDLGKKNHPSHFVIFEKVPIKDGRTKRVQRLSRWFDQVDYTEQLNYIEECCDSFEIDNLWYDSTRGELEMLMEKGSLPQSMEGVHFTVKAKSSMATALDMSFERGEIELLNDARQTEQIAIVNSDLQAPETPGGHGDSFWSIGMTYMDGESEDINISFI